MGDLKDLFTSIKDLPIRKVFIIVLIIIPALLVNNLDAVVSIVDGLSKSEVALHKESSAKLVKTDNSVLVIDPSVTSVPENELNMVKSYISGFSHTLPNYINLVGVYKFLPEGEDLYYQGRVLLMLQTETINYSSTDLIKELNLHWLPIWSARKGVELLLSGIPVVTELDPATGKQIITNGQTPVVEPDSIINTNMLMSLGVRTLFRYPVKSGSRVVGYLYWCTSKESLSKSNIDELSDISSKLASSIAYHIVSR